MPIYKWEETDETGRKFMKYSDQPPQRESAGGISTAPAYPQAEGPFKKIVAFESSVREQKAAERGIEPVEPVAPAMPAPQPQAPLEQDQPPTGPDGHPEVGLIKSFIKKGIPQTVASKYGFLAAEASLLDPDKYDSFGKSLQRVMTPSPIVPLTMTFHAAKRKFLDGEKTVPALMKESPLAGTFGAISKAGEALGFDMKRASQKGVEFGMRGYERWMRKANEYWTPQLRDVYNAHQEGGITHSAGMAIDWAQGGLGTLLPTMIEAATGAGLGAITARVTAGVAAGSLVERTLTKKTIEATADRVLEKQIALGLIKEGSESAARKEIRKQVLKSALMQAGKTGGKVGMGGAVLPMEAGANYAEVLSEHGIDAPYTALFTGLLATALEYVGGNSKLIDDFVGGLAKGAPDVVRHTAKELLTNIPEEALQEMGQESLSILNTVMNTEERFLTWEHLEQIVEAGALGALGGGAGAAFGGTMNAAFGEKTKEEQDAEKMAGDIATATADSGVLEKEALSALEDRITNLERLKSRTPKQEAILQDLKATRDMILGSGPDAERAARGYSVEELNTMAADFKGEAESLQHEINNLKALPQDSDRKAAIKIREERLAELTEQLSKVDQQRESMQAPTVAGLEVAAEERKPGAEYPGTEFEGKAPPPGPEFEGSGFQEGQAPEAATEPKMSPEEAEAQSAAIENQIGHLRKVADGLADSREQAETKAAIEETISGLEKSLGFLNEKRKVRDKAAADKETAEQRKAAPGYEETGFQEGQAPEQKETEPPPEKVEPTIPEEEAKAPESEEIISGPSAPETEAATEQGAALDGEVSERERKASEVGDNRKELEKELKYARSTLADPGPFKNGTFDFENKRLVSEDGTKALQWKVRRDPDSPESYENQQTSRGVVVVEDVQTSSTETKDIRDEIKGSSDQDILDMLGVTEEDIGGQQAEGEEAAPPKKKTGRPTGGTGTGTTGGTTTPKKSAKDVAALAAKHGLEGATEALKGLDELFGGGNRISMGMTFDEETYKKAVPHFKAALDHAVEVGKGMKELAELALEKWGDAIRPYLAKFMIDYKNGVFDEEAETTEDEPVDLDKKPGPDGRPPKKKRRTPEEIAEEKRKKEERKAERERKKKEKAEAKAREKAEKEAAKAKIGNFQEKGHVWDPKRTDSLIKKKSGPKAMQAIVNSMTPAKAWGPLLSGATPGLNRVRDAMMKKGTIFKTFNEYIMTYSKLQPYRGQGIADALTDWADNGGTVEELIGWAREYGRAIQPFVEAFQTSTDITQVVFKLQVHFGIANEDHTINDIFINTDEEVNSFYKDWPSLDEAIRNGDLRFMKIPDDADVVNYGGRRKIYRLITDAWMAHLASENDFLLDEINPHKRPRNSAVTREGLPDYGSDKVMDTDAFDAPFDFKSIGFGEESWIDQKERTRVCQACFNAFKDLAALIGAPDLAMSQSNRLSMQFANVGFLARAAAFFLTGQNLINLTRDNGDGTLSHEWFHSFHLMMANNEIYREIENMINLMFWTYDFDAGREWVTKLLSKDSVKLKRLMSLKGEERLAAIKQEVGEGFVDAVRRDSQYHEAARQMDNVYTKRREEMAARAFEAWVYDTLPGTNNYLVSDYVAAGKVGGSGAVGRRLVYPSGKEREEFNEMWAHFFNGLEWDEEGHPSFKEDYAPLNDRHEARLEEEKNKLLEEVETIYKSVWASEKSPDGLYWYQYDETALGPMMQPHGYMAYDKEYQAAGQNGTGAVGFPEQLHPDEMIDFRLSNIIYIAESEGLDEDVDGLFDEFDDETTGPSDAQDVLATAAKHGLDGAADALTGLYELFGGSSLKSFPGGLDREAYEKAKPHFVAAYNNAMAAGKTMKEFVRGMMEALGTKIKPLLQRFVNEIRTAAKRVGKTVYVKPGGTQDDSVSTDGTETPDEVSTEADGRPKGDGAVGGRDGSDGGEGDSGAFGPGKERGTTRGGEGSGDTGNDLSGPGTGSEGLGNYRITDDTLNDPRSINERFNQNMGAIKTLKAIEKEDRLPTVDEKEVMAVYSGWGGLGEALDSYGTSAWRSRNQMVKAEMTSDEIRAARQSSPNAYYTPVPVGRFMWKLAQRLGFDGGNVLDPSVGGNGLFLGTMPKDVAGKTSLTGIDRDGISARIAKLLYGKANIVNAAFQDTSLPNNRYDMVLTNVPFSGTVKPADSKHNKGNFALHNYFINKMLDLTAPGSIVMAVTTSGTLDRPGKHLEEFAKKADLVGAIRLPGGIFSNTEVVTDILIFRKFQEGSEFKGVPTDVWTQTAVHEGTGIKINKYFVENPEMVAGYMEETRTRWGDSAVFVRQKKGESLEDILTEMASEFPENIVEREAKQKEKSLDEIIPAPGTIKEGGLYINDKGEVCHKVHGEEIKLPNEKKSDQRKVKIAKEYLGLLDQVLTTLRAGFDSTPQELKAEQKKLKKLYNAFVKKFGAVNKPQNMKVYGDVTDSPWVTSLEDYDLDEDKVTGLSDIFTTDITKTTQAPEGAETDEDALYLSLNQFGYPNLDYMAKLRGVDPDTIYKSLEDRIIENPESGILELVDHYLSGNVRAKLETAKNMAQTNPEYERHVRLLEGALPVEITSENITARLGATWIKPEHITDFIYDLMRLPRRHYGLQVGVNYNPVRTGGEWSIRYHHPESMAEKDRQLERARNSVEAKMIWGIDRKGYDFFGLMEHILDGRTPNVTHRGADGNRHSDPEATRRAILKTQEIQARFQRWIFEENERAAEAVERFNRIVNTSVPFMADGSHLVLPGKSKTMFTAKEAERLGLDKKKTFTFYPQQLNAIWKYILNGNIYLSHEVGLGKTLTMVSIAMEARRLRGKKKVVLVTLNDSTMGQLIAEAKRLYPTANIMPIKVSTVGQRRENDLYKLAMNDFDIAVMRQGDLNRIALAPDVERVFIEEEVAELEAALTELRGQGERGMTVRNIEEQLDALRGQLADVPHKDAQDENLYFNDLGIDLLIVDEAHSYKNVRYTTKIQRLMGFNPSGSRTATQFFRKTRWLNTQYPKHDAIVLASGTPLTNSLAELYNIQRMLQPRAVRAGRVWSFDRWVGNFAEVGSAMEWDAMRMVHRAVPQIKRIINAGRLLGVVFQRIDSVRAKDTPVKRPKIRGGKYKEVEVAPNEYVQHYQTVIAGRAERVDQNAAEAWYLHRADGSQVPDNALRMYSNMSMVAIDQRLLTDPDSDTGPYSDTELQEDSKLAKARDLVFKRWQEEEKHKGVQLIFCDSGVPKRFVKGFKYKTEKEIENLSDKQRAKYEADKFEYENAAQGKFNVYDGLTDELVKLGIPREQIAFIHDADHSNPKRKEANLRKLYKKVNSGEIRILFGSTKKAGTGVNVQQRVSDIHHLDVWWNFSEWEQRNGRGIRAGNIYANKGMPGVYIWNYITQDTIDATRWDKVYAKGRVLNSVLEGDINVHFIEDISDEVITAKMLAARASGNPLVVEQAELLEKIQHLRTAESTHLAVARDASMKKSRIPDQITAAEKTIARAQATLDVLEKVTAVKFVKTGEVFVLDKHAKEIAAELEKVALTTHGKVMNDKDREPVIVFGSHTVTEKEVEIEEPPKKEGGEPIKKKKKVKEYNLVPLPLVGELTGTASAKGLGTVSERRIMIHGSDFLPTVATVGKLSIPPAAGKEVVKTWAAESSVKRVVGAAKKSMEKNLETQTQTIDDLNKSLEPLEKLANEPFPGAAELEEKNNRLAEVEREMEQAGELGENPEDGAPIERYSSQIPYMEDIAPKNRWREMYDTNSISEPIFFPLIDGSLSGAVGISGQSDTVGTKADLFQDRKSFNPMTTGGGEISAAYSGDAKTTALVGDEAIFYTSTTVPAEEEGGAPRRENYFWVQDANGNWYRFDPVAYQLVERASRMINNTGFSPEFSPSWKLVELENGRHIIILQEDRYLDDAAAAKAAGNKARVIRGHVQVERVSLTNLPNNIISYHMDRAAFGDNPDLSGDSGGGLEMQQIDLTRIKSVALDRIRVYITDKRGIENPTDADIVDFLRDYSRYRELQSPEMDKIVNHITGGQNATHSSGRNLPEPDAGGGAERGIRQGVRGRQIDGGAKGTRFRRLLGLKGFNGIGTINFYSPAPGDQSEVAGIALDVFGVSVRYWDSADSGLNTINGAALPAFPKTVFVRADATNPLVQVMGHEAVHQLRVRYPGLYDKLSRAIKTNVVGFQEYVDRLNFGRKPGDRFTTEGAFHEFYGDFIGDQLTRGSFVTKFLKSLAKHDNVLARRLAGIFLDILERIKNGGKQYPRMSERYINSGALDQVRQQVADILAELTMRQKRGDKGNLEIQAGTENDVNLQTQDKKALARDARYLELAKEAEKTLKKSPRGWVGTAAGFPLSIQTGKDLKTGKSYYIGRLDGNATTSPVTPQLTKRKAILDALSLLPRVRDAKYNRLARNPKKNAEELQKMVDEAAREAGAKTGKVYHVGRFDAKKDPVFRGGSYYGLMFFSGEKIDADERLEDYYVDEAFPNKITEAYLFGNFFDVDNKEHIAAVRPAVEAYWSKNGGDVGAMEAIENGSYQDIEQDYFIEILNDLGFEGLTTYEGHGKNYGVLRPSQIKSADPVTYDDRGNVIPLSERFNEERDEIYFQTSSQNSPADVLPAEVREEYEKAKGVKPVSFLDKLKEFTASVATGRAHFPGLSKGISNPERATLQETLRHHQDLPHIAQRQAAEIMRDYLGDLSVEEQEVVGLYAILSDEVRSIKEGIRTNENLPFKFTSTDQIEKTFRMLKERHVNGNDKVKAAIRKRDAAIKKLKTDLVRYGILKKEVLKKKDYFHHQILAYYNPDYSGIGTSSTDVRTKHKGWMKARQGSALSYNTEFAQVEFMVMAQQIAQIETAKAIEKIQRTSDITGMLKAQAKENNDREVKKKLVAAKTIEPDEDPFLIYKQRFAMNAEGLGKKLEKGQIVYDSEFDDVVKYIIKNRQKSDEIEGGLERRPNHPRFFHFLSHLMNRGGEGAMEAAGIFKAIKDRERFTKDVLGKSFQTARSLIPDGYVSWQVNSAKRFFYVNTLTDQVIEQVKTGERALEDKDVRQALARGRDTYWIIPKGLATTLDTFRAHTDTNWVVGKASHKIMNMWKQYILMNPLSVVRYNLNNASGDLDICLAYNPAITKSAPKAAKDLWRWQKFKKTRFDKELDEAHRLGVIGSGFSVQDVEDVMENLGSIDAINDVILDRKPGLWRKYWKHTKGLTTWRENVLRFAAYRHFKEELKQGKTPLGVSNKVDIENLLQSEGANVVAAKLARELLGDYGNLSHHGEMIRRHLIPFWSWMEINAPRYVYLMRNAKFDESGGGRKQIAKAGSAKAARQTALFAMKASMLFTAITLWNSLLFPDEDDELGEAKRRQLHLILGRRQDGSIITMRFQGALSDALSWFGMEDLPSDIEDVVDGRETILEKLIDIPVGLMQKMISGLRPDVKVAAETLSGESYWPDYRHPRSIRDRWENVLKTLKLDSLYRMAAGRPSRGGESIKDRLAHDFGQIFVYAVDPGQQAYYDAISYVRQFKKKHGTDDFSGFTGSKKSNYLYYYKKAVQWGNVKAADKYLHKYIDAGGTPTGMQISLQRAHPLSSLKAVERADFWDSLTTKQKSVVNIGEEWYFRTYTPN